MYEREKAIEFLDAHLEERRKNHSIRVMETAIQLARIYGEDEKKAEMAAILHDSGKWKSKELTLQKVREWGIILSNEEERQYNLVHGSLSVYIAKNFFGIEDEDVINAIKYHITGRENMSKLEKIVYLADMIEPGRDYNRVDEFRKMAKTDLDKAMYEVLNDNIRHLLEKNAYIAIDSLKARNFYLK